MPTTAEKYSNISNTPSKTIVLLILKFFNSALIQILLFTWLKFNSLLYQKKATWFPNEFCFFVFQLRFYYHMRGLWGLSTMGTLRVRLRNTITGSETAPLWQESGNQGNQWLRADVKINTTWSVAQVGEHSNKHTLRIQLG